MYQFGIEEVLTCKVTPPPFQHDSKTHVLKLALHLVLAAITDKRMQMVGAILKQKRLVQQAWILVLQDVCLLQDFIGVI